MAEVRLDEHCRRPSAGKAAPHGVGGERPEATEGSHRAARPGGPRGIRGVDALSLLVPVGERDRDRRTGRIERW